MKRPMSREEKADMAQKADLLDDLARRLRLPKPDPELIEAASHRLEQWARDLRAQVRTS